MSVSAAAKAPVRAHARASASLPPSATSTSTEVGDVASRSIGRHDGPLEMRLGVPSPLDANTARSPVAWRLIEPEWATLETSLGRYGRTRSVGSATTR